MLFQVFCLVCLGFNAFQSAKMFFKFLKYVDLVKLRLNIFKIEIWATQIFFLTYPKEHIKNRRHNNNKYFILKSAHAFV